MYQNQKECQKCVPDTTIKFPLKNWCITKPFLHYIVNSSLDKMAIPFVYK